MTMTDVPLEALSSIDGFIAAALVDTNSGSALASYGHGIDLTVAAAGNTEVIRCKRKVTQQLGLGDDIDDILITLSQQYHLIRPLDCNNALFLYVALERCKANLAMARHELRKFEKTLTIASTNALDKF